MTPERIAQLYQAEKPSRNRIAIDLFDKPLGTVSKEMLVKPYDRCKAAGLSDRDHLVLLRVASGRMDKEIATELGIERTSVSNILSRIYQRLGLAGRVSAALWLYGITPEVHPA